MIASIGKGLFALLMIVLVLSLVGSCNKAPQPADDSGVTKPIAIAVRIDQNYNEPGLLEKNLAEANESNADANLSNAEADATRNDTRLKNEDEAEQMVGEAVQWIGRALEGEAGVTSAERSLQKFAPWCLGILVFGLFALFLLGRRSASKK